MKVALVSFAASATQFEPHYSINMQIRFKCLKELYDADTGLPYSTGVGNISPIKPRSHLSLETLDRRVVEHRTSSAESEIAKNMAVTW